MQAQFCSRDVERVTAVTALQLQKGQRAAVLCSGHDSSAKGSVLEHEKVLGRKNVQHCQNSIYSPTDALVSCLR
jgi:hypothetical protein